MPTTVRLRGAADSRVHVSHCLFAALMTIAAAVPAGARPVGLPVFGADEAPERLLPSFVLATATGLPGLDSQQTTTRRPVGARFSA